MLDGSAQFADGGEDAMPCDHAAFGAGELDGEVGSLPVGLLVDQVDLVRGVRACRCSWSAPLAGRVGLDALGVGPRRSCDHPIRRFDPRNFAAQGRGIAFARCLAFALRYCVGLSAMSAHGSALDRTRTTSNAAGVDGLTSSLGERLFGS